LTDTAKKIKIQNSRSKFFFKLNFIYFCFLENSNYTGEERKKKGKKNKIKRTIWFLLSSEQLKSFEKYEKLSLSHPLKHTTLSHHLLLFSPLYIVSIHPALLSPPFFLIPATNERTNERTEKKGQKLSRGNAPANKMSAN
jgi:hypothetical protein